MAETAVCLPARGPAGRGHDGKSVAGDGLRPPIGILCILAARRAGADLVVATDLSPFTLEMPGRPGADLTINMAENSDGLDRFTPDQGHVRGSVRMLRRGPGTYGGDRCHASGRQDHSTWLGGDMSLPVMAITAKELELKGSFRFHEEFFTAVSLMQKGLIDVKPFITQTLPLEEAVTAFELASDRSQAVKAQIAFA